MLAKVVQPAPAQRSSSKLSSLFALSVQVRSIWLEDTAFATRSLGAAGGVGGPGVVAQSVFEKSV